MGRKKEINDRAFGGDSNLLVVVGALPVGSDAILKVGLQIYYRKGVDMKCPDWIESWKEQYDEDADCEVLKADIKIVMRRDNGEIIVRHSEYKSKHMPKIQVVGVNQGSTEPETGFRRW